MYALKVQVGLQKDTGTSDETAPESTPNDDSELDHVDFTAGNPRVEHITGVVHLYRTVPHTLPLHESETGATAVRSHTRARCCIDICMKLDKKLMLHAPLASAHHTHAYGTTHMPRTIVRTGCLLTSHGAPTRRTVYHPASCSHVIPS
jgi:hypothetical protein